MKIKTKLVVGSCVSLALLLLLALLAANPQHIVVQGELDVLFLDARHFEGDPVLLVRFLDVERGTQQAAPFRRHRRQRQARPASAETAKRIVEQTIHLAVQLQ